MLLHHGKQRHTQKIISLEDFYVIAYVTWKGRELAKHIFVYVMFLWTTEVLLPLPWDEIRTNPAQMQGWALEHIDFPSFPRILWVCWRENILVFYV